MVFGLKGEMNKPYWMSGVMMNSLFEQLEFELRKRYEGWDGAKHFIGTGERLGRMLDEMCWSNRDIKEEIGQCLSATFDDSYDEMLVSCPTSVWTLCPHHLLPCHFSVTIGYIPVGKVLGLSKFSRVAVVLGKRPVIQEQYSRELADILWDTLKPEGVGVVVVGKHGCMLARGIKQNVDVSTSILLGSFKEDPMVREEFYNRVSDRRLNPWERQ